MSAPSRPAVRASSARGPVPGEAPPGAALEVEAARRPRGRGALLAVLLAVALAGIALQSLRLGSTGAFALNEVAQGLGATLGWTEALPGPGQTILELHLFRTLVAIAVGASLALSGGLMQGLFRNALASPSIVGVSPGASLGAALAILVLGGYGLTLPSELPSPVVQLLVPAAAFAGGLGAVLLATTLATSNGRLSVPTLLLTGLALNATVGGLLQAVQSFVLSDFDLGRAIYAWGFGTLDARSGWHAGVVWSGLLLAAAVVPFVATELDLLAGGEDDAAGLGVNVRRTKTIVLTAAALAAAAAISVSGQIAFVGLVVPHLLRLVVGTSHRTLLPLCLLGGPTFLLGADVAQRWAFGASTLQPGVMMSLVGGPFFLFLLVRQRGSLLSW